MRGQSAPRYKMVGSAFGSIQEWIFPVGKGEEKAFFAKPAASLND
jgi:hypothetical protein